MSHIFLLSPPTDHHPLFYSGKNAQKVTPLIIKFLKAFTPGIKIFVCIHTFAFIKSNSDKSTVSDLPESLVLYAFYITSLVGCIVLIYLFQCLFFCHTFSFIKTVFFLVFQVNNSESYPLRPILCFYDRYHSLD